LQRVSKLVNKKEEGAPASVREVARESKKRARDALIAHAESEPRAKKKKVDKRKVKAEKAKANSCLPPPGPEAFPEWTPREFFKYEVVYQSKKPGSRARVGKITTPHGVIHTPAFVPVGTNGALKAVDSRGADETGVQLMFCNTYHLLVHPGPEVIEKAGGLHKYMNRTGPIITDSGGFQVFSLATTTEEDGPELKSKKKTNTEANGGGSLLSVEEEGCAFRSYYNGQVIELTPESSVQACVRVREK